MEDSKRETIRISEEVNGQHQAIEIRKIENGYIKRVTESGTDDKDQWFNREKEIYMEELPQAYKDMMEDTPMSLAEKLTQ